MKKDEKSNQTITLNVLCTNKNIYPAYVSKQNSILEKQIILLMIANGEGRAAKSEDRWHDHAVKELSALLREITSNHYGDFYCLNCRNS